VTPAAPYGAGPTVSLVVPNMNNGPVLDLFFERLAEHTTYRRFELIVADDGSTDDSLDVIRRWRDSGRFDSFTLLEREHAGIVATLNAALDAVGGDLIVRLDGDATVETPGWLERMLAFRSASDRIGVTVPKVIFDSGRVHTYGINVVCPEGIHDRGTRMVEPPGRRTGAADLERPTEAEATAAGFDEPAEVDAALGCWTMFPTALARELGGWDMAYSPVWFEDIDFSFAARTVGRKVFFQPDVRVIHRVGMRDPRTETSRAKLALIRANRRFGRLVPQRLKDAVAGAASLGERDPAKGELMSRHLDHWRAKWGFDPVNPDVDAILERYAGTEVCWRHDPEMRAAGERIATAYGAAVAR
jgi:GT2 family glycosyltransferase